MNNTCFSALNFKDQQEVLLKINALRSESNWQAELEFIELILKDEKAINRQNRQIWYERAIALDMLGRPSEAVAILKALTEIFPLHHNYAHSLFVTTQNLARKAITLFKDDRANKNIEIYVSSILETSYCPWGLTEIYLDYLCLTDQTKKAKKIITDYVDLSPFDSEFLEKSLEIAVKLNDIKMLREALEKAKLGLSIHPYNYSLKELITKYFNTESQIAS